MIDDEEEIAFRLWTADTGNASRIEWNIYGGKDRYMRMARAAKGRDDAKIKCDRCDGSGWLEAIGPKSDGSYITSRPCPKCYTGLR